MADERLLPNLKTRLTLDSADYAKGREQADQLRSSLAGVGDGAKQGGEQLKSGLITPLRAVTDVAQVFASKKIFDFAKAGFDELKGAAVVTAQSEVQLKNLGSRAGITEGQIDDLSQAMLEQSGVDDEMAKSAATTALRLGVTGDAVKRVVQDSNDLSQSFGDINSDSELLAKALAKPEQAARLLKPAIGALTDEQTKSIAAFVKQGDTAAAGNVILQAVEDRVHGAASAFGETLPGAQARSEQSMNNLRASMVGGAAPALKFVADSTTFLTQKFDELPDAAKTVIGTVTLVGAGVGALVRPVTDVLRLYSQWSERSSEVTKATEALATAEASEATAAAASAASSAEGTATTVASTVATNESAAAATRRAIATDTAAGSSVADAVALDAETTAVYALLTAQESSAAMFAELNAFNDAYYGSSVAATVATEGETLAFSGLLATLGPLAVAVGVGSLPSR
jgi:hypothetical protein